MAREALRVQEQSEQLAQELREVTRSRASLRGSLRDLRQYLHVLREGQRFTSLPVGAGLPAHLGVPPRASVSPRIHPSAPHVCRPPWAPRRGHGRSRSVSPSSTPPCTTTWSARSSERGAPRQLWDKAWR